MNLEAKSSASSFSHLGQILKDCCIGALGSPSANSRNVDGLREPKWEFPPRRTLQKGRPVMHSQPDGSQFQNVDEEF